MGLLKGAQQEVTWNLLQLKPWSMSETISYFSIMTATASSSGITVCPLSHSVLIRKGEFKVGSYPYVVNNKPARLVPEDAVDPRYSLYQVMTSHGLIHVHGVKVWGVKTRLPHIPRDYDFQRIGRSSGSISEILASSFVPDRGLSVLVVRDGTGHHNFNRALLVVIVVPFRPKFDNLAVEVNADTVAHADDHGHPLHRLSSPLEVIDYVLSHEDDPFLRADDGLKTILVT